MRSFNIITGEKGKGKTTLISRLSSSFPNPAGFISIHEGENYYLLNLRSREKKLLMSRDAVFPSAWKEWYVNFPLFDEVYSELEQVKEGPVFLDECGRMEMEGLGFDRTLKMLLARDVDLYITLRRPFLKLFVSNYSIVNYSVIEVESGTEGD